MYAYPTTMMNACGRLDIGSKMWGDLGSLNEEIDHRVHKLARGSSDSCIQSKGNPFKNVNCVLSRLGKRAVNTSVFYVNT